MGMAPAGTGRRGSRLVARSGTKSRNSSSSRARPRNVSSTPDRTSAIGLSLVRIAWFNIAPASPPASTWTLTPVSSAKAEKVSSVTAPTKESWLRSVMVSAGGGGTTLPSGRQPATTRSREGQTRRTGVSFSWGAIGRTSLRRYYPDQVRRSETSVSLSARWAELPWRFHIRRPSSGRSPSTAEEDGDSNHDEQRGPDVTDAHLDHFEPVEQKDRTEHGEEKTTDEGTGVEAASVHLRTSSWPTPTDTCSLRLLAPPPGKVWSRLRPRPSCCSPSTFISPIPTLASISTAVSRGTTMVRSPAPSRTVSSVTPAGRSRRVRSTVRSPAPRS